MLLFWRIRYLDTSDKQFKDRDLWLNTADLSPAMRAEIEYCFETSSGSHQWKMLPYRNVFQEKKLQPEELNELVHHCKGFSSIVVLDYFEDEKNQRITRNQIAQVLSGSQTAIMLPHGAKQHDIDYIFSEKKPIPIAQISLTKQQLDRLAYFSRDLRELTRSSFAKDGPGTLTSQYGEPMLQTATSEEEITSFVMIFRRLYMTDKYDHANFQSTANTFSDIASEHPIGKWVYGVWKEYERELECKPDFVPFGTGQLFGKSNVPFTRKQLIDVFLYTRYAHQPNSKRTQEYTDYLKSVNNYAAALWWLFLGEMWHMSLHMRNAGNVIVGFYEQYCTHHKIRVEYLASVSLENAGIGSLEKREDKATRLLTEKGTELAQAIWRNNGCPPGGYIQFLDQAINELRNAIGS